MKWKRGAESHRLIVRRLTDSLVKRIDELHKVRCSLRLVLICHNSILARSGGARAPRNETLWTLTFDTDLLDLLQPCRTRWNVYVVTDHSSLLLALFYAATSIFLQPSTCIHAVHISCSRSLLQTVFFGRPLAMWHPLKCLLGNAVFAST